MPFLQKKSVQLTFSSLRTANYKVPSRIGGHHFLLCQQTNTKDIAGQSAKSGCDEKAYVDKESKLVKGKFLIVRQDIVAKLDQGVVVAPHHLLHLG